MILKQEYKINDKSNGSYEVIFKLSCLNTIKVKLFITYHGKHIKGSPFTFLLGLLFIFYFCVLYLFC